MKHEARIEKDLSNKCIRVIRAVDAATEKVWRAFTQRELLDQWWAPKPWTIETVAQDFKVGGHWHFFMSDTAGKKYHWRVDYVAIDPLRSITTTGGPCDEQANLVGGLPSMRRLTEFSTTDTGTEVSITIMFENLDDMEKMAGSGMLQGTTAVFDNLEELMAKEAA